MYEPYEAIAEEEEKPPVPILVTVTDKPKVVKITSHMKQKALKLQISDLEYIKLTPSA